MTGVTQKIADRANDHQVGGDHYRTGGLQHWDLFGPEYLMGCATKYISRWRKKNGVQDLEKGLHYAEKLLEIYDTKQFTSFQKHDRELLHSWCQNAGLDFTETTIIFKLLRWNDKWDIEIAIEGIRHLIETERNMTTIQQIANLQPKKDDRRVPRLSDEPPWTRTYTCCTCGEKIENEVAWNERDGDKINYFHDTVECRASAQVPRVAQRTPEDGAQHAALAPWQITSETYKAWSRDSAVRHEAMTHFYKQVTPDIYRLEPVVWSREILSDVQACYTMLPGPYGDQNKTAWLLRIDRVPEDLRDSYPRLQREMNAVEYEQSDQTYRFMYLHIVATGKYELMVGYDAWGREQ